MSRRPELSLSSIVFYTIAFGAIAIHLSHVFGNLSNIPNGEDFEFFLEFLNSWSNSESISSKIALLFGGDGGHPKVVGRLLALICWKMAGQLNFSFLVLVGNLLLILSFLVLIVGSGWSEHKNKIIFFVVPLLIFQPQFMREFMWASGGAANIAVVFFGLSAIYFATRTERNSGVSSQQQSLRNCLICSILSALSGMTGLLVPGIAGLYYFLKKRSLSSFVFLVIGGLCAYILILGVEKVGSSSNLVEPVAFLSYLTSYFGSVTAIRFETSVLYGSMFVAAFLCLVGPLAVLRPFISASLLFFFLIAVVHGLTEHNFSVESSFNETRYRLISSFFIALLWLGLIYNLKTLYLSRQLSFVAFTAGLAFSSMSYLRFSPYFDLRKAMLEDSVVRYQVAGLGLLYPDQEKARRIAFAAERNGVYSFPPIDEKFLENPPIKEKLKVRRGRIVHKFEHIIVSSNHVFIDGYAFLANMNNDHSLSRLRLKSGKGKVYTMSLNVRQRPDLAEKYIRRDIANSGFFGMLNREELPLGVYRVFVLVSKEGVNYYTDAGIELILSKETPV